MKEFQLSRYLKKWLPFIVAVCFAMTAVVYLFLQSSQTYVASAVIHYNDESAQEGLTPLGTELDVNEIKSSSIMSRVLVNLELDGSYSVDDLISRVDITEVVDEDEAARKEALLEEGEEYIYEPTTFIVAFTANQNEGASFARQVLDEMLDLYFSDYSEQYVNVGTAASAISQLYSENYDYLEMVELIDEDITQTIESLTERASWDNGFRSARTGMSFADLSQDFNFLYSVKLSDLYSRILEYQVTRDKDLLVANYTHRMEENNISNQAEQEMRDDVVSLIDAYVTKMRDSGNTDITYEYILDDVYEKDLLDVYGEVVGEGDQTVTYDKLIFSWRDHSETRAYAVIDSAYCQYILDCFQRCTGQGECASQTPEESTAPEESTILEEINAPEDSAAANAGDDTIEPQPTATPAPCTQSDLTCAALNDPDYQEIETQLEEDIRELVDELNALHEVVNTTNEEYNEYRGAQSISTLSSSSVEESINVALYTAVAAFFLLVVCCCGAILLGRLNDIIQYVFYTDHMTGMHNRTAFDDYLKRRSRQILNDGTVCATVAITNQAEINQKFGRDVGDETIRFFAETLKDVFHRSGAYLVYNGNAQFFAIVEKTDFVTVEYMLHRFHLLLEKRETLREEEIHYEMGLSESYQNDIHRIRGLLSKAMAARAAYTAKPVSPEERSEKTEGK